MNSWLDTVKAAAIFLVLAILAIGSFVLMAPVAAMTGSLGLFLLGFCSTAMAIGTLFWWVEG